MEIYRTRRVGLEIEQRSSYARSTIYQGGCKMSGTFSGTVLMVSHQIFNIVTDEPCELNASKDRRNN